MVIDLLLVAERHPEDRAIATDRSNRPHRETEAIRMDEVPPSVSLSIDLSEASGLLDTATELHRDDHAIIVIISLPRCDDR